MLKKNIADKQDKVKLSTKEAKPVIKSNRDEQRKAISRPSGKKGPSV